MRKVLITTVMFLSLAAIAAGPVFAERDGIIASDAEYVDDYTIKGPVNYADIDPIDKSGNINVVVEIPAGTNAKWEVSADTGNIVWEFKNGKPRVVNYEGGYPVNYGTVPKTLLSKELGGEGESLDIILFGSQLKRGAIVKAKLIGILRLKEGDGTIDDKLLAVVQGTPEYNVNNTEELNADFNNSVANAVKFFRTYKGADSGVTSRGIGQSYEAMRLLYSSLWDYKLNN